MLDNHGRNIDYLRVSLTDSCNLRCIYCMPEEGIKKKSHSEMLRLEEVLKIVEAFAFLGIRKVRYTGGEPLVFKGIEELIYKTSRLGPIKDIAITTNGVLLEPMAEGLKKSGLKRVNISLDTLKAERFKRITRVGTLNNVLSAIDRCLSLDFNPIKINNVIMSGINDDEIEDFINLTKTLPIDVRFIELMPIGEGFKLYGNHRLSLERVIQEHPELLPVNDTLSGTAKLFQVKGANGRVGFINPLSCKFCSNCNKIRLTASGTIKPCLHSEEEINIKEYLGDKQRLLKVLSNTILNKPSEHHLEEENKSKSHKAMYEIGG
jgi:GTP 3',8-cyclase